MRVETPIPPIMMNAAAPDGAPPRRIRAIEAKSNWINLIAPLCLKRGPEAGDHHKSDY
jgi:hypothetical protein